MGIRAIHMSYELMEEWLTGNSAVYTTTLPSGFRVVDIKTSRYLPRCAVIIIEHDDFEPHQELEYPEVISFDVVGE